MVKIGTYICRSYRKNKMDIRSLEHPARQHEKVSYTHQAKHDHSPVFVSVTTECITKGDIYI